MRIPAAEIAELAGIQVDYRAVLPTPLHEP
jgi:hypothetical protein